MIVGLDHIGIVAHSIDEARATLETRMGFSLDPGTPLPNGAYFAPEGTHNYMFQVGTGETRIEDAGWTVIETEESGAAVLEALGR